MPNRPEAIVVWQILKPLLIFPKGLPGGLVTASVMWTVVILGYYWNATRGVRTTGYEGPVAIAGGWQYLVQVQWVVVLLSVSFGLGFFAAVSWVARHP